MKTPQMPEDTRASDADAGVGGGVGGGNVGITIGVTVGDGRSVGVDTWVGVAVLSGKVT